MSSIRPTWLPTLVAVWSGVLFAAATRSLRAQPPLSGPLAAWFGIATEQDTTAPVIRSEPAAIPSITRNYGQESAGEIFQTEAAKTPRAGEPKPSVESTDAEND